MPNCEFCGKELEPILVEWDGKEYEMGYHDCDCPQAVEARRKAEAEELERLRATEAARISADIESSGIPKRYRYVSHERAYEVAAAILGNRNCYIYGNVGTGKTTLASAAGLSLINDGEQIMFMSVSGLLSEIREFNKSIIDDCKEIPVLILDDLGKENPTGFVLERLFDIVDYRYSNLLPTIVTSQYSPAELGKQMATTSGKTAVAIISRLRQECDVIELTGKDRRLSC